MSGESGIGKSRLLNDAAQAAGAAGWRVLRGGADEEVGALPYLSWLPILRSCVPSADTPDLEATGVDSLLSALGGTTTAQLPPSLSPEQQKRRLFDIVLSVFTDNARACPILIILDDIQWFDSASAELLHRIATHASEPLHCLLAGRSDELHQNGAVQHALDELNRHRLLHTLPLHRLTSVGTSRLLAGLISQEDASLTNVVHEHSEGNPFFIEELLKPLAEEQMLTGAARQGLPMPRGIVAVIERRLARLSADCLSLLRAAAHAGRRFPLEPTMHAAGLDADRAGEVLDEALGAAVLQLPTTDADAETGEFTHDRIREVVLANLNPLRRRTLHIRLGEALEAQPGRHDPAQLAYHFAHGHDRVRAARYARQAADDARQAHAYVEAARFYQQALLLSDDGGAPLTPDERATLLFAHGEAAAAAGDYTAALASLGEAAATFMAAGEPQAARWAHREIGAVHARREDATSALAHYRWALDLLGEEADTPDTAELLARFGSLYGLSLADYQQGILYGQRGLAMSTRLGDARLEANARLALANTILRRGDLPAGYAILLPALELAELAGDPLLGAEVSAALANYYDWIADLDRSQAATERRRDLARSGGDPYALHHVDSWLAHIAYARGHWTEAEVLLVRAEPFLAHLGSPEPRAFHQQIAGLIRFQQGDAAAAATLLHDACATFRRIAPGTLIWYLGCLSRSQLAAGEEPAARRTLIELETVALRRAAQRTSARSTRPRRDRTRRQYSRHPHVPAAPTV